jgi:hypothetical protein
MNFTKPTFNQVFTITSAPGWPSIDFETNASGTHTWEWSIEWDTFTKSGKNSTPANQWDAKDVLTNYGGTLTVRAWANNAMAIITVRIKGENPSSFEVTQYLATKPNAGGFDKIIEHESKFLHFNSSSEPVKSFDDGYGICQLTTPAPTFDQVWNWKLNVDGGLKLFDQKRSAAIAYLSQSGRTYTNDQLKYETVCRWNGGSYHEWDSKAGKWVRKLNILCDSKTGNIGWDMNDVQNKGKTEKELHKRDSGSYSSPPEPGAHWMYSGVCYADSILL